MAPERHRGHKGRKKVESSARMGMSWSRLLTTSLSTCPGTPTSMERGYRGESLATAIRTRHPTGVTVANIGRVFSAVVSARADVLSSPQGVPRANRRVDPRTQALVRRTILAHVHEARGLRVWQPLKAANKCEGNRGRN